MKKIILFTYALFVISMIIFAFSYDENKNLKSEETLELEITINR